MALTPVTVANNAGTATPMGAFQDAAGDNYPAVVLDNQRATFRAAGVFTPYATAALTLFQIQGSASKTVRITRIGVAPTTATTVASLSGYLARTTGAGSGGTGVTPTIAKMDTASAAATAVVTHYTTAAQSVGAGSTVLSQFVLGVPVVSVPTVSVLNQMQMVFPECGAAIGQAIVLRGTSDYVCVVNTTPANFANAVSMSYVIEWVEDAS